MPDAVIVDDERPARRALRTLLAPHPEIRVVGEAETLRGALEVIRATEADTVFLDVQLGRESGLDLVPELDPDVAVVFVTAFDRYAVRAFELNALDFLLKPIMPERLATAISRLTRARPPSPPPATRLQPEDFLFVRAGAHMRFLKIGTIVTVAAEGPATLVRLAGGEVVSVRKAIGEWEDRLPLGQFARIHRSTIVNLEFVVGVDDWFHSAYQIRLRGVADPVPVSRRYAALLRSRLR